MPKHLYLPHLTGENISIPDRIGHWDNKDHKIILGISDGISIDESASTRGVSSVPDIWARPLVFQSALKPGSHHPLHKRVQQEWKGLLSLFALAKLKNYEIEIVPVQLDEETFSKALRRLAPKSLQLQRNLYYSWTDILLIRYKGYPIGAFSPTTLVYTATQYNHYLKAEDLVLKDNEGYLCPPKSKEDLEYVGKWVAELQRKLNNDDTKMYSEQSNSDHRVVTVINDLLTEWLKEIRTELKLRDNESIHVDDIWVSAEHTEVEKPSSLLLEKYKIYKALTYPLEKNIDVRVSRHSDISLKLNPSRNHTSYKEVLIITTKLLESNARIWDSIKLKDLGGEARSCIERYFPEACGTKIGREDISRKEAIWVRPEKYFLSDTLLKAKDYHFLVDTESNHNLGTRYVLPFRKEVFNFFSSEDIKEKLKPVYKEEDGIVKFSFVLPIIDTDNKEKEERVEKIYRAKGAGLVEGKIKEVDVPTIEIFPNYLGDNWRRYYLFQSNAETFAINPVVYGDNKTYSRVYDEISRESKQKIKITEITGNKPFPEGLQIKDTETSEDIGLILFQVPPPENTGLSKEWKIGIDFGTSNTNVYKKSSVSEMAERWSFKFDSYVRKISNSNNNTRRKLLQTYFVPSETIELPIPTTLRIFNLAHKKSLLIDYFIFFTSEYQFADGIVYSDIKWDVEGERKTEHFIESLLFLIFMDVANHKIAKIKFACSYPKAFSETTITLFKSEWDRALKNMLEGDNRVFTRFVNKKDEGKAIIEEPTFETEGIAAGSYFGSEETISNVEDRADKEIAAICLDIGGGTTDISIWYEDSIVFDASVLMAGRQIARLFQKNSRVIELLFTSEAAIALDEKKGEPASFAARLNLILKNEELRIQEMLIKYATNKDIQWFRRMLAIEFAALAFYAGMLTMAIAKKLRDAGDDGLIERISSAGIKLHWGGNAAKFINWIDFGRYDKNGIASKILNAVFYQSLEFDETDDKGKTRRVQAKALAQLQSPGHKSEVSGGLVVMTLGSGSVRDQEKNLEEEFGTMDDFDMPDPSTSTVRKEVFHGMVCGENIQLSHKEVKFIDFISPKEFFEGSKTKFKLTKLDRLVRFVEVMNFFSLKFGLFIEDTKINLTEDKKRVIRDSVLKDFIRAQQLKEGERLIDPTFIMEITFLLEILRNELK